MWTETIRVEAPYNFDLVLDRLSLDPLQIIDFEKRTIKVPLYIEETPLVVQIQSIGHTDNPTFILQGERNEDKEKALERVKKVFHFHEPLSKIATHFQTTDLQALFTEHRGTPIVLDFDYYSCLVRCIIHQQLNLSFAHTLTERYVKTFGFEIDGVPFFPTPERAAKLTVEELRDIQFSTRKAEYVIGLSQKIATGELHLKQLAEKTDTEIIDTLVKIRGIGNWTAENFLLSGVGRPNLFPGADIGIQRALQQVYNLPQKPTKEEMLKYSESWSPYLSYASLYLWRSTEKRSEKK
ncbi:DNA-3-methyladenine glycosylase family protein [Peribacillus loiseleuriae]|uniref:DNA-3-methyladenine glycosylase family protein n=1 Tax=Peribacillus loiseleuriae TaxID=1679170 RepID=UPI003828B817